MEIARPSPRTPSPRTPSPGTPSRPQPPVLPPAALAPRTPLLRRLDALDWLYALALALGAAFALYRYHTAMDVYDDLILVLHVPVLAVIGWHWKPFRAFLAAVALLALASIALYQGDLARAEQTFLLKYLISSQTAIMWMSALIFIATGAYWLGLIGRSDFGERTGSA
ncbi:MAG: c-type cytochrome biogenesis protein CcsB, partial [Thauera sp.]